MEVPPNLLEAAERKLAKLDAFLDDSGWVEVGFVEEQNPRIADKYHCEIVAHVKGKRLKVEGSAAEPFGALDRAAEKVDRRVRRLKDKRIRRRRGGNQNPGAGPGNGDVSELATFESNPAPDTQPPIADAGEVDGKPMTPAEAALQLGLLGQDFLLFQNAESGCAAVVYRRRDGDYGLVQLPA